MDIKSLEALQQPDDRTLHFTPYGLGPKIGAEKAARFQQENIAHLDLADVVPEHVRAAFDQLRRVYAYGVLCYDVYALAHGRARLVVEYALRERFLEYYSNTITFIDRSGTEHTLQPANFDELYTEIHRDNRLHKPQRWRLRVDPAGATLYFDGMLDSLMRWARAAGLLSGQRNRNTESLLKELRNQAAHATGFQLLAPGDASSAIADLAEVINRLWGARTPGGRLYPAPISRVATVIMWADNGNAMWSSAEYFRTEPADEELTCVVVLAKEHDDDLSHFDAQYETTQTPCELLWGPGTASDAEAWLEQNRPKGDEVDVLDRLFMVRYHDDRLYLPRSPDIAAGLDQQEQTGTWYLVRADSPLDVFNHLRQLIAGGFGCTPDGHCKRRCPVQTIGSGTWQDVLNMLIAASTPATPRQVPDTRVPSWWPRWNENLTAGTWSVPMS